MNDDWFSKLSALKDSMEPCDTEDTQTPEKNADKPRQTTRLDIVLDRKGRAGKTATIVCGFTIDDEAVAIIASKLKQRLGTGGSARGGEILIQGDRRNDVLKFLTSEGYKARII